MTPPLPWFLPGRVRIRGGAARKFPSDWLFHRGIHLEPTLVAGPEILDQNQNLTRPRR
jgi:hypothetical protein